MIQFTRKFPGPFAAAVVLLSLSQFVFAGETASQKVTVEAQRAGKIEKVKLALNWKPEPQFGGFYAARTAGIDKKNGVDLEILPGGAGTPVVQMVAAGKFDFGIASADEVVMSRANGSDVIALFAVYQTNPQAIMVHEERGFESLADVFRSNGKLALQKGLPYARFLLRKYPDTRVQVVPYLGGISNFLTDKSYSQQSFVTAEPLAAKRHGRKTKAFLVAEEGYNPYTTVLITRDEVVKKNIKLVKSLVASVRQGWRLYLDRPEETNRFMAQLNRSMDLTTFAESATAQVSLIETAETKRDNQLGQMTEERWEKLSEQLLELKLIKKKPLAKLLYVNL